MEFPLYCRIPVRKGSRLPLHRAYWRDVPLRRLTSLLIAIFCLFGMLGCFTDLLDQGQKPFLTVIVWSLWSGFIAVLWILALLSRSTLARRRDRVLGRRIAPAVGR